MNTTTMNSIDSTHNVTLYGTTLKPADVSGQSTDSATDLAKDHNTTSHPHGGPTFRVQLDWTAPELPLFAIAFSMFILIAVLGLGNIITLHYTVRQRRLKRPFNLFIAAMAFGDLLLSDVVGLLEIYDMVEMGVSNAGRHKRYYVWCAVKVSWR